MKWICNDCGCEFYVDTDNWWSQHCPRCGSSNVHEGENYEN